MIDFPICPFCSKTVDTHTEAHITEQDGTVKHAPCPVEEAPAPEEAAGE